MDAPPVPDFDLRGFIENSLLEWEGMLCAVAIAGGCNLRCPYCHSWRYVTGLDKLKPLDVNVLFNLLERQKGWIDGVVFTGGEPTLQPGLADIMRRTKEYGVRTKLHTNGTRPDVVEALIKAGLLDCLSLDFKAPLDEGLHRVAGVRADAELAGLVRKSFDLARSTGVDREYHTTLSPAFVDAAAFARMAEWLEPEGLWILQQYESGDCLAPAAAGAARYDGAALDGFEAEARKRHGRVVMKRGSSA